MQVVAQSWLVIQLTGSGTTLGLVAAAQFLPVLLLGAYGGLVADRVDKRRLLLGTQTALGLLALVLGLLTVTHVVQLWMVFVLAVALGTVSGMDLGLATGACVAVAGCLIALTTLPSRPAGEPPAGRDREGDRSS